MKRLTIIFVVLLIATSIMADKFKIGKLTFEIKTPTTVGLIDADEDIENVFLSETIDYKGNSYTLTYIGYEAFWRCESLTSVTIPNSVTSIEGRAFKECTSLTSVTIPNSVTSIGWFAFEGTALYNDPANWENGALYIDDCLIKVDKGFAGHFRIKENTRVIAGGAFRYCSSLTSVTIPNSVTSIGEEAFDGCESLTSVTIPDGVTSIGYKAFKGCKSLTSVSIPSSVTRIGYYPFKGCTSLTSMVVASGNSTYDSRDNCNAIIETATNTLFAGCQNTTIPNSVTSVGDVAFAGCTSLTSVTIPNSVTSIGEWAFEECTSLTSVTIPNGVTSIGWGAFSGCTSLTSVTIPNSVTSIGVDAFGGCTSLTSVTIPNSVTSIGYKAFKGTALYNDPSNWENGALYIDNCLIKVDEDFAGHFRIKENTRVIADYAFSWCYSLTSVTIPNSVTSIGKEVFWDCTSLTSVTIPNSVTSIGEGAFEDCTSLTSVTIPNSVTSIGEGAFPKHTQIIRQ